MRRLQGSRAWVITDSPPANAQARRLDGKIGSTIGEAKRHGPCPAALAHCPSGFTKPWPFRTSLLSKADRTFSRLSISPGARPPRRKPWRSERASMWSGNSASSRCWAGPPSRRDELRHFKDKRVRIFADADEPGLQAEGRWWHQLESAGARVDGYSFAGFIRSDGSRSRTSTISRSSTLTNGKRRGTPSRRHSHFQTERKPMEEGSRIKTKPERPYTGDTPGADG